MLMRVSPVGLAKRAKQQVSENAGISVSICERLWVTTPHQLPHNQHYVAIQTFSAIPQFFCNYRLIIGKSNGSCSLTGLQDNQYTVSGINLQYKCRYNIIFISNVINERTFFSSDEHGSCMMIILSPEIHRFLLNLLPQQ